MRKHRKWYTSSNATPAFGIQQMLKYIDLSISQSEGAYFAHILSSEAKSWAGTVYTVVNSTAASGTCFLPVPSEGR